MALFILSNTLGIWVAYKADLSPRSILIYSLCEKFVQEQGRNYAPEIID